MPSVQLARYLQMRADGATVGQAAARVGFALTEAKLTEKAVESGDLTIPAPGQGAPNGETDMPEHDKPENEQLIDLAADTLRGDIRDALLSWFKAQPTHWSAMKEQEQIDLADAADRYAFELVKETAKLIAAGERPTIVATLVEYKEKDGVEAKLKLPSRGEVVAALHEACGREVLLVTSGAEEFLGEAAPAEISKDQPELGIGAEYEEAA